MRILILSDGIPPDHIGGAELVAWRLAQAFQQQGHEVHIICRSAQPAAEWRAEGISIHSIQVNYPPRFRAYLSLYQPQVAAKLKKLFQQIQPDIINAHNIHQYLTYHSLNIAHKLGIPLIFSAHDAMPIAYTKIEDRVQQASASDYRLPFAYNLRQNRLRYNPFRQFFIRRALSVCAFRTSPSQALAQALEDNGLPPFEVVPNGIDLAHWQADHALTEHFRQELALVGKQVILIAGRLNREKGMGQILAAFQKVLEKKPDTRLLILSAKPLHEQIPPQHPLHSEIGHRIISGAWRQGVALASMMALADIVTSPSIYLEPFNLVNIEAMALGRAVVTTRFGGPAEVVQDGQSGRLVNPFDIEAYSQILIELLEDQALRQRLGENGRQRVESFYTLQQQSHRMLTLFQSALEP
ncbi:glycosyltransferase family 4 protein [Anaerolineales bacterium]